MSQIILSFGKIQLISSRLDLIKWSMSHETLQHSRYWYVFMRSNLNGGNWICTTRSLGHLVESALEIFICYVRNSNVEKLAHNGNFRWHTCSRGNEILILGSRGLTLSSRTGLNAFTKQTTSRNWCTTRLLTNASAGFKLCRGTYRCASKSFACC